MRALFLASLGGALEFYDFIIFGTFAGYISKAFFPANDPTVSLLLTFMLFAAGYLARPIGGLFFGDRGDRHGRRGSFVLSLAVMSAATVAMGLVPSYAQGGVACTLGFVLLRLVQGFCLGGELPGAITYAVELVPERRATFACGLVFGCVTSGVLLATGLNFLLSQAVTAEAMQDWGWRLAFVFGGLLACAGWLVRRSLEESPAYLVMRQRLAASGAEQRSGSGPLARVFRRHGAQVIAGILATSVVATFNGLLFAFLGAYLGRVIGYPPADIGIALNVASAAMAISLLAACWLADMVVPRLWLYRAGCLVIAAGAVPAFAAMAGKTMSPATLFLLVGLSAAGTHGTFAAILAHLFPTAERFSGVALTLNLGAVLFSGPVAAAAQALIAATGDKTAPAWLLVGAAVLSFGTSFVIPKVSAVSGRFAVRAAQGAKA
ncbi:MAG: MFS transporter [Bradyrhizobium sp.]